MSITVYTIDESTREAYTIYSKSHLQARFGHDLAWAEVLRETYGVETRHLIAFENEKVIGVCPLFFSKPLFGGAHYVTNPFPTFCGPLTDSVAALNALLREVAKKTSSVDHAEVLNPIPLSEADAVLLPFQESPDFTFKIRLNRNIEDIQKNLRTNFKRILSKTAKLQGLEIVVDLDGAYVDEFYKSYARIYAGKHGFIPHTKSLFKNIFTRFPKGGARLYMARINGKFAGGIFVFWSRNEAYYAWSAVEPNDEYQPAHNTIWRIIQDAVADDLSWFNMGEAARGHESLILFKQGWGAEMSDAVRYFIPGNSKQPSPRLFDRIGWLRTVIAKLPPAVVTTFISPAIRYFI